MKAIYAVLALCTLGLAGCAAVGVDCRSTGTVTTLAPLSAAADHSATAPGNQQKFTLSTSQTAPAGCAIPEYVLQTYGTWTSSDPLNVSISSASDPTNGTATCTGSTAGPVTLIATYGSGTAVKTATASLTCK